MPKVQPVWRIPPESVLKRGLSAMLDLGDRDLQELLGRCDEKDLARALHAPAVDQLRDRCLRNLPAMKAQRLQEEWAWMKPDLDATALAQGRLIDALTLFLGESFSRIRRKKLGMVGTG